MEDGTRAAAEDLLATLRAGRASLMQLAATQLPFSRLAELQRLVWSDLTLLDDLHVSVDRRVAILRGAIVAEVLRARPDAGEAPDARPESVEDEPTPQGAATVEPKARPLTRIQRSLGKHEVAGSPGRKDAAREPAPAPAAAPPPPAEPAPSGPAEAVASEPAETVAPQPAEAVAADAVAPEPAAEPVAPAAPPAAAEPEPVAAAEPVSPPVVEPEAGPPAAAAIEPVARPSAPRVEAARIPPPVAEPAAEPTLLPEAALTPEPAVAPAPPPAVRPRAAPPPRVAEPEVAPLPEAAVTPLPPPLRPRPVPAPRLAAADEDTGDPGTPAPGPARISLGAPRAAPRPQARVAAEEDLVAQDAGDEDELESEGSGVAVGSGLRVKRGATAASSAPRLTDDEPLAVPTQEEPATLVPAGDDGRVETLLKDAGGHSARGDLTRAIQAFTDVLDLRHDRADAYIGRGRCYLELGDYSSAMSDFQRAEDLWPNRPDPHVAMGDLYYNRKEYRRAIEFYDHAVEFDSSHAMARCRRGISHYYRKNFRQAFQDLQRAYQLDPDIPNIRKYVQMAVKKMERGE